MRGCGRGARSLSGVSARGSPQLPAASDGVLKAATSPGFAEDKPRPSRAGGTQTSLCKRFVKIGKPRFVALRTFLTIIVRRVFFFFFGWKMKAKPGLESQTLRQRACCCRKWRSQQGPRGVALETIVKSEAGRAAPGGTPGGRPARRRQVREPGSPRSRGQAAEGCAGRGGRTAEAAGARGPHVKPRGGEGAGRGAPPPSAFSPISPDGGRRSRVRACGRRGCLVGTRRQPLGGLRAHRKELCFTL